MFIIKHTVHIEARVAMKASPATRERGGQPQALDKGEAALVLKAQQRPRNRETITAATLRHI
jgi:hypothetical protein